MRVAVVGSILLIAADCIETSAAVDPTGLSLVREAALAAQEALKSGRGSGVAYTYARDGNVFMAAKFNVAFDGSKTRLEIEYQPPQPGETPYHTKRIVIWDGSALFSSELSPRLHPTGSTGFVHRSGAASFSTASGGFPRFLGGATSAVMILAKDLESREELEIDKAPDGGYRGSYRMNAATRLTFYADPKAGYHVVSLDISSGLNAQRERATWAQDGDVWYIQSWSEEMVLEGKLAARHELEYEEFSANCEISPELFTLNALELAPGSRITDHRERGTTMHHKVPEEREEGAQQRLDSMVAEVEALPPMYPTDELAEPRGGWIRGLWAALIALAGLIVVQIIWRLRRKRTPSET